ncbi:MAG: non-canonical purine NTP diphosphatase [Cyclobacteriaceae bacterium]
MKLCFATNNDHKLMEVREVLGDSFEVLSLKDVGCEEELPEDADTIEGNSLQKAQYLFDHYNVNCFADDTGLEVQELNGEPGVYSARYAGAQRSSTDNIRLLLSKLEGKADRSARFKTVITLIEGGEVVQFEGIVNGVITEEERGAGGFGYDPIFLPDGYSKTMAEMTSAEKNAISHRGRAVQKLHAYLSDK